MSKFFLVGRIRQWFHCLTGMFNNHCEVTQWFDYNFGLHRMYFRLGCTCGKTFWVKDGDIRYETMGKEMERRQMEIFKPQVKE